MKKLLLLALLSMTFSAAAKDKAVSNVKTGLVADIDIWSICVNIASGGHDVTLGGTLANISKKYSMNKAQVREHVFTNSYCKVDGKCQGNWLSKPITPFRLTATISEIIIGISTKQLLARV